MSTINCHLVFLLPTRMHSSRMRTGRSLTVCWSLLRGGCLLPGGSAPGGSAPGGCLLGGCMTRGVCSRGKSSASDTPPPPPVNRMTDRCKNITLATTSLRPVIMDVGSKYSCLPKDKEFLLLSMCKGLSLTMIKRRITTR